MKKPSIIIILAPLILTALAACQGQAVSPQPAPTEAATPSLVPTIQATLAEATPTQPEAPAGCTAISPKPTPGPTETSLFPPVSPDDWVKGPADASITLTEYSDFQ